MRDFQGSDHTKRFARLSAASQGPGPDYLRAGREALACLLADSALLDGKQLDRVPGGYTRNLLFGDERITVFAMVWSAGARTSIHDHHCSCCYAILSGSLQEGWYDVVAENRVALTREFTRSAGQIACMLPTGPNLHRMENVSGEEAISIHIYGYDRHTRTSSIGAEYRAPECAVVAREPALQD